MIDTEELKALLDRAAPGPWSVQKSREKGNPESPWGYIAGIGIRSQALWDAADDIDESYHAQWICGIWGEIKDRNRSDAALIALAPDLAAELLALRNAARAVVERWDSTPWPDLPHTRAIINALRKALDAGE